MKPRLAILIPTIDGREQVLHRMKSQLLKQAHALRASDQIIILEEKDKHHDDGGKTTGAKRNILVHRALHEGVDYIAHFDDDDLPGHSYIQEQLRVVNSGMDSGSLWGNIYFSGIKGKPFHHSIRYDHWFENKHLYARCPNHLNCIKLDIAKNFPFEDIVFGEDGRQSEWIAKEKAIKSEYQIEDVIYHYFTGNKTNRESMEYINELIKQ